MSKPIDGRVYYHPPDDEQQNPLLEGGSSWKRFPVPGFDDDLYLDGGGGGALTPYDMEKDKDFIVSKIKEIFEANSFTDVQRDDFLQSVASEFLSKVELPTAAPELWMKRSEKHRAEKPPVFIARVYDTWLGKGLTQAHVHKLDPQLYGALHNWLRKNEMPKGLDLPTKSEAVTREIEAAGTEGLRAARRLNGAVSMRRSRHP